VTRRHSLIDLATILRVRPYLLCGADVHAYLFTIPWAHPTHHPKQQPDRFSSFCMADAALARYPIPPPQKNKLPLTVTLGVDLHDPSAQTVSRLSRLFFHNTRSLPTGRPIDRPPERTRNSTCKNKPLIHYKAMKPETYLARSANLPTGLYILPYVIAFFLYFLL